MMQTPVEKALGLLGGIQFIPVGPDHEHYPPEPSTFLVNETKSRAYVRAEEWPWLRAELRKVGN